MVGPGPKPEARDDLMGVRVAGDEAREKPDAPGEQKVSGPEKQEMQSKGAIGLLAQELRTAESIRATDPKKAPGDARPQKPNDSAGLSDEIDAGDTQEKEGRRSRARHQSIHHSKNEVFPSVRLTSALWGAFMVLATPP